MIDYEEYLRAHFSDLGVLIVELGRYCPVECAHCHVESDKSTREHLSADEITSAIQQFGRLPSARFIALTGGEPFSYKRALGEALKCCVQNRLKSYVLTSALWALSMKTAIRALRTVGLPDLMGVSFDRYHLQKVPLERSLNALKAGKELGISVFLALGSFGPEDPIRLEVKSALRAEDLGGIQIINYPLLARGKGAELPELQGRTLHNAANEGCLSIGTPVLTTSGTLTACCHTTVANDARAGREDLLVLGDGSDIDAASNRYRTDPIMQVISRRGPLELARQKSIVVPPIIANRDICEACDFVRQKLRERRC